MFLGVFNIKVLNFGKTEEQNMIFLYIGKNSSFSF